MKKIVSILSLNKYLEIYLSALGTLIVVIGMWVPFGWRTTDLNDGWRNFQLVSSLSLTDVLFKPFISRFLLFVPWKLGYLIDPNSFLGVRLIMATIFWGKSFVFYLILRKLRLAPPYLAFLLAILFMLYPADQGIFWMSALGRHFAVLFYLLAVLFLVIAARNPQKRLPVFLMLLSELVTGVASEQGFLVMLITPAILFLDQSISRKTRRNLFIAWYAVLIFCILLFVVNVTKPYSNITQNPQASILEDNSPSLSPDFIGKLVESNLTAYRLFFYDGWRIAVELAGASEPVYLYISLGIALCAVGIAYFQSRLFVDPTSEDNIHKYFWVVMIGGVLLLVLSYLPYSVTTRSDRDFRVFYYAAIGGAIITGYLLHGLTLRLSPWKVNGDLLIFGPLIFLISVNGLNQHSAFVQRSLIQQRVLINIVEQAPYISPNTEIVLLTDDLNEDFVRAPGFVDDKPFKGSNFWISWAIEWMYDDKTVKASQCDNTDCLQKKPIKKVIIFQYTREHSALLLDQMPENYKANNASDYQPYKRIKGYAPYPEQYSKRFDVIPDPARVSPRGWRGSFLTMNDRKVCDISHSGNCSLFFHETRAIASFTQAIKINGNTNDQIAFSLWVKSQSESASKISIATLTVLYTDGAQAKIPINSRTLTEWDMLKFQFTAKNNFSGLVLTFQPDAAKGAIWLDDIQLSINEQDVVIFNPSFER